MPVPGADPPAASLDEPPSASPSRQWPRPVPGFLANDAGDITTERPGPINRVGRGRRSWNAAKVLVNVAWARHKRGIRAAAGDPAPFEEPDTGREPAQ